MASLTELHGGSIMYNLFQRYKRKQIYVSSACSSSGEEVCVAQCAGPTFTSSVIHPQHATPHTQRPLRLECSGFFSPTSKEYVLPFECLSLISEKSMFCKVLPSQKLERKKQVLLTFLLRGPLRFEVTHPLASCADTPCVLVLSVLWWQRNHIGSFAFLNQGHASTLHQSFFIFPWTFSGFVNFLWPFLPLGSILGCYWPSWKAFPSFQGSSLLFSVETCRYKAFVYSFPRCLHGVGFNLYDKQYGI